MLELTADWSQPLPSSKQNTYGEDHAVAGSVEGECETGRDSFAVVLDRVSLRHGKLAISPVSFIKGPTPLLTPMENDQYTRLNVTLSFEMAAL